MSNITVMTLHGLSGSGKDSTYTALAELNPNLPRVSFGDLLRRELYAAINRTPPQIGDERGEQWLPNPLTGEEELTTFKDLMVGWGRRQTLTDPFHYADQIRGEILRAYVESKNSLVVVTDCRRPHELAEIRKWFRTYSFWLEYEHATPKPLDRILEWDEGIHTLDEGTIQENVDQIIDYMIRNLPLPIKVS